MIIRSHLVLCLLYHLDRSSKHDLRFDPHSMQDSTLITRITFGCL